MLRSAEPEGLEGVLLGDLRPCPAWESHCGGKGISLPQSGQGASGHLCWRSRHPLSTAAQLAQPPLSPGAPHGPTRPLAPTAHLFCRQPKVLASPPLLPLHRTEASQSLPEHTRQMRVSRCFHGSAQRLRLCGSLQGPWLPLGNDSSRLTRHTYWLLQAPQPVTLCSWTAK